MVCRICGNSKNNQPYTAKEFIYGSNESFEYIECNECGCLQILEVPCDMGKFYPSDYFSFVYPEKKGRFELDIFLTELVNASIINYYTKKGGILSKLLCMLYPELMPPIQPGEDVFNKSILDVGCGNGKLLKKLANAGFTKCYGVDPFINEEAGHGHQNNVTIFKSEIFEISDTYDVIMLNHSFEHMDNQENILLHIRRILNDDGTCIIRIPTVSSDAWDKYKEHWIALDAPRHLYLHSIKSIRYLCDKCGFKIDKIVYDSIDAHFLSKMLKKGVKQDSVIEYMLFRKFSPSMLIPFAYDKLMAKWLNFRKRGYYIAVHISKVML